jgi:ADP-ribosyl-[dinitrogen reductase] hydrolase
MQNTKLDLTSRLRGCLLGLAVGDALGTTLEFNSPGSFTPISDMVGGGPFSLKAGQWTDDTSMALCLAESLAVRGDFDPADQMQRYVRWWQEGHLSSNGRCFDIGITVRGALNKFQTTGNPYAGSISPDTAGNGSLMRLAPVPMFYHANALQAIVLAGNSSRTTHGTAEAVDACRYYAGLLVGAIHGVSKAELLSPAYSPVPNLWVEQPLAPKVVDVATGSFKRKQPPQIRGTGYVVAALEASLWAFHNSEDFRTGALLAVNLGDDADTTGAIYGQLAGAYYGEAGIPETWRAKVCAIPSFNRVLDQLMAAIPKALGGQPQS